MLGRYEASSAAPTATAAHRPAGASLIRIRPGGRFVEARSALIVTGTSPRFSVLI
jgi:hypothetical protein